VDAFGVVVIVVSATAAVVALLAYRGADRRYREIGRMGRMSLDDRDPNRFESYDAIREEMRQTREAIAAERRARGEPPLAGRHD
jgi:hypothetical protein